MYYTAQGFFYAILHVYLHIKNLRCLNCQLLGMKGIYSGFDVLSKHTFAASTVKDYDVLGPSVRYDELRQEQHRIHLSYSTVIAPPLPFPSSQLTHVPLPFPLVIDDSFSS